MKEQLILILSFPIVFMIHDFEEIIGIEPWIKKNVETIYLRFPKLAPRLIPHLCATSTQQFAGCVFVMFLFVCSATYISVFTGYYQIWMGAFIVYSLHLIVHITQWIAFRRYVPAIITSAISVPYCIYGVKVITEEFTVSDILAWTIISSVVAISVLFVVHKKIRR
jgi:hypothetical protein